MHLRNDSAISGKLYPGAIAYFARAVSAGLAALASRPWNRSIVEVAGNRASRLELREPGMRRTFRSGALLKRGGRSSSRRERDAQVATRKHGSARPVLIEGCGAVQKQQPRQRG